MSALKIELLRRSRRIRLMTWIGLLPILGLPFAMIAVIQALFCRQLQAHTPNPAANSVRFALIVAPASIVVWLALGFILGRAVIKGLF